MFKCTIILISFLIHVCYSDHPRSSHLHKEVDTISDASVESESVESEENLDQNDTSIDGSS